MNRLFSHLSREIQNQPDNYSALVDRAEVYISSGDYAAAQADLAAAKALQPENWYAYYLTGLSLYNSLNIRKHGPLSSWKLSNGGGGPCLFTCLWAGLLMKQNEPVAAQGAMHKGVAKGLETIKDLSLPSIKFKFTGTGEYSARYPQMREVSTRP